jgi:glycosyltransferase involved in cell wall biosynthesis
MWKLKKKWFTGVKDMTIVTPSQWLADLVKESYLKEYPVKVINNGIDLSVFKPTQSDFKKKYNCEEKFVILGVANVWDYKKGLDVFIELANRLDEHKYQIVLVGTDDNVDKQLPEKIISIHRTNNQAELAEIYSAADLLLNPTREDTFPTVNIESLACGTPVFTFKTGGSPEIIDETCGRIFNVDDVDSLENEIYHIASNNILDSDSCVVKAGNYNCHERFCDYVNLY